VNEFPPWGLRAAAAALLRSRSRCRRRAAKAATTTTRRRRRRRRWWRRRRRRCRRCRRRAWRCTPPYCPRSGVRLFAEREREREREWGWRGTHTHTPRRWFPIAHRRRRRAVRSVHRRRLVFTARILLLTPPTHTTTNTHTLTSQHGRADTMMQPSPALAELTTAPKMDTHCTTLSLMPPVTGTRFAASTTHGQLSAARKLNHGLTRCHPLHILTHQLGPERVLLTSACFPSTPLVRTRERGTELLGGMRAGRRRVPTRGVTRRTPWHR
jgi:hypothetical protein